MEAVLQMPQEPPTDEALIAAHLGGDSSAFETLFGRYRGRVMGYAMRMLGRRELAEEVCSETFVKVLEGRWKPTGRFRAVLFTVVHRACLERLRRRRTAQRFVPWLQVAAEPDPDPEHALLGANRTERLDRALGTLSEEHRAPMLLYYGQDLASKDVATVLGCSDQQVRSRLSYARRKLRQTLEDSDGQP